MFANTFNRILPPLLTSLSSTLVQQSRAGKRQVPKKGKAPIVSRPRFKTHYHIKGGRDIAKLSKLLRFNTASFRPLSLSILLPVLISDQQTSPFRGNRKCDSIIDIVVILYNRYSFFSFSFFRRESSGR